MGLLICRTNKEIGKKNNAKMEDFKFTLWVRWVLWLNKCSSGAGFCMALVLC